MNFNNEINPVLSNAQKEIKQNTSITTKHDFLLPDAASKNKIAPYIIRDTKERGNLAEYLQNQGVIVESTIDSIDSVTATLDEETKTKLASQGFDIIPDKDDIMLPPMPWEIKRSEEDEDGLKNIEAIEKKYESRPSLLEPRFNTPLAKKYTGEGVTIAVIDSGLYPHPDFISPQNRITAFVDMVNGRTIPYDDNGHGTHVAGDAAGSGYMSNGLYRGPAPNANLIGIKVLSGSGSGRTSDVVKGIDWAIKNKDKYGIKIINLSLGHPSIKNRSKDPVDLVVEKAYKAGIVVVAAAGNSGPHSSTISAPGDSPYAITVGAADDKNTVDKSDDKVTEFSSRGPTKNGENKPDIIAPGEVIIAPNVPGTEHEVTARRFRLMNDSFKWLLSLTDEELKKVPPGTLAVMGLKGPIILKVQKNIKEARQDIEHMLARTERKPLLKGEAYVGMPGTSMASPIVAGVVAQLLEANPNLSPRQIKKILKETAEALPLYGPNTQGSGMVNPEGAIQRALDLADNKPNTAVA